ncbi:MAG: T9SS type A sorting domain-containing protein [Winogradskyella sp.]|nr:MAG: T9SS type A sorting domain-containing protein [Winogradskyella sp.]
MKKITLLCFLIASSFAFAQDNWTTGDVQLGGTNYTVNFNINPTTDVVTMRMVGPANVWLTVSPGTAAGNGMGSGGEEAISFNAGGNNIVQSRSMNGGFVAPATDATNAWTTESVDTMTTPGSVIVIATRSQNSAGDYAFPDTPPASFPILWARGSGSAYIQHPFGNRGGAIANMNVLSNENFQLNSVRFTISPNPSANDLNIGIFHDASRAYNLEVYDVLGKQIYRGQLTRDDTAIDVRNWRRGVYLVKLTSDQSTQTKRFIKQ